MLGHAKPPAGWAGGVGPRVSLMEIQALHTSPPLPAECGHYCATGRAHSQSAAGQVHRGWLRRYALRRDWRWSATCRHGGRRVCWRGAPCTTPKRWQREPVGGRQVLAPSPWGFVIVGSRVAFQRVSTVHGRSTPGACFLQRGQAAPPACHDALNLYCCCGECCPLGELPGPCALQRGQGAPPACHAALNFCLLLWRVLPTGGAAGAAHPCLPPPPWLSLACTCCPAGGMPLAETPGGAAWVTPSSNPRAGTPLQDAFKQSEVGTVSSENRKVLLTGTNLKCLARCVRGPSAIRTCIHVRLMQRPTPSKLANRVKMSTWGGLTTSVKTVLVGGPHCFPGLCRDKSIRSTSFCSRPWRPRTGADCLQAGPREWVYSLLQL